MWWSAKQAEDLAVDWTENTPIRWHHLRIRPTALGYGMIGIALASWILALNYEINLAYGLAFWILAFSIWAMLQGILQLYGVSLHLTELSETFAGDTAYATLNLQGNLRHRRLYFRFRLPENLENEETGQPELQLLNSQHQQSITLPFPTTRRGMMSLPILQIYTHAPYALLSVGVFLQTDWRLIVYPQPVAHPFTPHGTSSSHAEYQIQKGSDDIAYLSEYVQGDNLKKVAWKQYAKSGQLMSKQSENSTGFSPDTISWKDYPENPHTDALSSYLCERVLQAEETHQPYVLELPYETIERQNGQRRKALVALSLL